MLGTVRERMIYDRETVAVQAGRPVEFRLTNTDNMPHNFAVVLPGTMAEVGELAEATGRDQDAAARQFIPRVTRFWSPANWFSRNKPIPSSLKCRRSLESIRTSAHIPATGVACTEHSTSSRI
jgi:hypothetical protein